MVEYFASVHNTNVKKNMRIPKPILSAIYNTCYVSLDFEKEMLENGYQPTQSPQIHFQGYEKKDVKKEKKIRHEELTLGVERFAAPEIFFKPSFVVKTNPFKPLDEMVLDCIRSTPAHLHSEFLKNVVLVGENTKFRNLDKRLAKDIKSKIPNFAVNVSRGPKYSAWRGAKILSGSDQFLDMCTDPAEMSTILLNYKFF